MTADQAELVSRCIATNVRDARERADLSQDKLSIAAGLHRSQIGMLERGLRLPRVDTLIKLAGGLDVPSAELLKGVAWVPPVTPGTNHSGFWRS